MEKKSSDLNEETSKWRHNLHSGVLGFVECGCEFYERKKTIPLIIREYYQTHFLKALDANGREQVMLATMGLLSFEQRFKENMTLHEGCDWERVKLALMNNFDALLAIGKMTREGHEPTVYNFDKDGFDIGTCSRETPISSRNCVYNQIAEQIWSTHNPDIKINGNAVDMSKEMGVELMSPYQYRYALQPKGVFDRLYSTWLFSGDEVGTRLRTAWYGSDRNGLRVNECLITGMFSRMGWRGTIRVQWAA